MSSHAEIAWFYSLVRWRTAGLPLRHGNCRTVSEPLLAMHLVFDYLGYPRFDPSSSGFIVLSVVQLLIMGALVAVVFCVLRPLENNPLPLWDSGFVPRAGGRSPAVGALLCVAGAATLASVGWGLKDEGLYCVAAMLIALVAARSLASDPQRVCAASLPASTT
jgi:hypothetical protein